MKVYTAQTNRFGNIIVCGDEITRKSYTIIFTGTYPECMAVKFAGPVNLYTGPVSAGN